MQVLERIHRVDEPKGATEVPAGAAKGVLKLSPQGKAVVCHRTAELWHPNRTPAGRAVCARCVVSGFPVQQQEEQKKRTGVDTELGAQEYDLRLRREMVVLPPEGKEGRPRSQQKERDGVGEKAQGLC